MDIAQYIPQNPCICINLRRVAQRVTDYYDRALKPAGVSLNQYSLLVNIYRIEGCGTGELAQAVRLEKSTLVRTVQPLLRDGLVTDRSAATDRRRRLFLTAEGRAVLVRAYPLWTAAQDEVAARLGKNHDQLMAFFEALDGL